MKGTGRGERAGSSATMGQRALPAMAGWVGEWVGGWVGQTAGGNGEGGLTGDLAQELHEAAPHNALSLGDLRTRHPPREVIVVPGSRGKEGGGGSEWAIWKAASSERASPLQGALRGGEGRQSYQIYV